MIKTSKLVKKTVFWLHASWNAVRSGISVAYNKNGLRVCTLVPFIVLASTYVLCQWDYQACMDNTDNLYSCCNY